MSATKRKLKTFVGSGDPSRQVVSSPSRLYLAAATSSAYTPHWRIQTVPRETDYLKKNPRRRRLNLCSLINPNPSDYLQKRIWRLPDVLTGVVLLQFARRPPEGAVALQRERGHQPSTVKGRNIFKKTFKSHVKYHTETIGSNSVNIGFIKLRGKKVTLIIVISLDLKSIEAGFSPLKLKLPLSLIVPG